MALKLLNFAGLRWRAVVGVLVVLVWAGVGAGAQAAAEKPNMIFVIADDMLREMFNCLPEHTGKNLTPNLDRIAREGMVFPQFHCASSACTPSRFNVLTGRYGSRARNANMLKKMKAYNLALVGWNTYITPRDKTVASLLQEAGYKTGFVGKNHVVEVRGYNKKIDRAGDPASPLVKAQLEANAELVERAIRKVGFDFAASIYHKNPASLSPRAIAVHNMDWMAKGGLDFIDQYKEEPFFLYFAPTATHAPYEEELSWNADPRATPEGWLEEPLQVLPARSTIPQRLAAAGLSAENGTLRPHLLQLDDALGALFATLKEHDLEKDTLIFFFNDHGMEEGKSSCYEGGALTMAMVWRSGGFAGGNCSEALVSNIDFAPTLLDFAGVEVPEDLFDGESFRPLLEGKCTDHRDFVYCEMGCARSLQVGQWKYIAVRYPEAVEDPAGRRVGQVTLDAGREASKLEIRAMESHPGYFEREQLYHLAVDPHETNNLAGSPEQRERLEKMRRRLFAQADQLPGGFSR